MENKKVIFDFYNNGAEIGRLENGLGMVEFYRSKEIISQYITKASTVYDIGGGIGKYSEWLAENGHDVTMIELAPTAVDYAIKNTKRPYTAIVGDARKLDLPDQSADVVLLMGPLYHLQNINDILHNYTSSIFSFMSKLYNIQLSTFIIRNFLFFAFSLNFAAKPAILCT